MNNTILKTGGTNYIESEELFNTFSPIFSNSTMKADSFVNTEEDLGNGIIDLYNEYEKILGYGKELGMEESTIEAFCKQVEYNPSFWNMKFRGSIYYSYYINSLLSYLFGDINKEELKGYFVEYSLFDPSKKPTPTNVALFRKTLVKIEELYNEIVYKQIKRKYGKQICS